MLFWCVDEAAAIWQLSADNRGWPTHGTSIVCVVAAQKVCSANAARHLMAVAAPHGCATSAVFSASAAAISSSIPRFAAFTADFLSNLR